MTHFLVFGHRGSPRRFPENSIESFEETLRVGADGFETDLRLLADGQSILFHDDELGDQAIETLTAPECHERGVRVARLAELASFAGRCTMILEVKRGGWDAQLLSEVGSWPGVVIASFDHTLIRSLAERKAGCELGVTIFGALVAAGEYVGSVGASWCFPSFRHVTRPAVELLHQRSVRVIPWTPNRESEWETLRAIGCDGIITDDPEGAVRWRERTGGQALNR
ncbi:MAG TPA: glycerophosphodiester phosphodiesterase [Thermoanaerobaculia bacterium]|nr:glycerophosphodiester phosphodiesterase [Thermoanaerobaculia bacterium]